MIYKPAALNEKEHTLIECIRDNNGCYVRAMDTADILFEGWFWRDVPITEDDYIELEGDEKDDVQCLVMR